LISAHVCTYVIDHVELESEIKMEQVNEVGWSTSDKLRIY
jgi:hypothetical protein